MEIKVNDKYVLHSENGMDYQIEVININDFRDPLEKYGLDVIDGNGIPSPDVIFVGEDFFLNPNVERR